MISREEARNELRSVRYEAKRGGLYMPFSSSKRIEALDMAIEALSQPKRPKGRWECAYDEMLGETEVTCSHCKDTRTIKGCYVSHDGESIYYDDNFCPNCGSDNRGEEE